MEETFQLRVCGESGDVQGDTVKSWKEKLPEITSGYTRMTYGTWRKLVYFGKFFLIMVLVHSQKIVKEEKKINIVLQ